MSFSAPPEPITALVKPIRFRQKHDGRFAGPLFSLRQRNGDRDGIDLSTVKLPSYRSNLGVAATGRFFCLKVTIRENIRFWQSRRKRRATERRGESGARAGIPRERFEKGLDTIVGERG